MYNNEFRLLSTVMYTNIYVKNKWNGKKRITLSLKNHRIHWNQLISIRNRQDPKKLIKKKENWIRGFHKWQKIEFKILRSAEFWVCYLLLETNNLHFKERNFFHVLLIKGFWVYLRENKSFLETLFNQHA
jgi:hypothetical protein